MGKSNKKDVTLNEVGEMLGEFGEMLGFVVEHMATKEELAEVRRELKRDIFNVSNQVNSLEAEMRGMRHGRLEVRVADLEEKVFGEPRS